MARAAGRDRDARRKRDGPDGDAWRFSLPDDYAAVLLDPDALDGVGGTIRAQIACFSLLPRLVEAYRTGGGIPFADYGPDMIEGQAASTRPVYSAELATWFAAVPEVAARLALKTVRILDIGCGASQRA